METDKQTCYTWKHTCMHDDRWIGINTATEDREKEIRVVVIRSVVIRVLVIRVVVIRSVVISVLVIRVVVIRSVIVRIVIIRAVKGRLEGSEGILNKLVPWCA